jgi:hypothetical protein
VTDAGAAFRDCLDRCDVAGVRALWGDLYAHLPQPGSDFEVRVMIHRARTEAQSVVRSKRYYSHAWLVANGLPSGLPEKDRPKAERRDFTFAFGVGIVVKTNSPDPGRQAFARIMQRAMSDAVAEAVADGVACTDTAVIQGRMRKARRQTTRALLGR